MAIGDNTTLGDPPDVSLDRFAPDSSSTDNDSTSRVSTTTLRNAIGSGSITTSVDPDTGRATQSIGGIAGTVTTTAESEDDVTVGVSDPTTSLPDLRDLEQTTENATDGAAFGDPNVTETINSETSHTIAGDSSSVTGAVGGGIGETGGMTGVLLALAAVAAAVILGGE